MLVASMMLPPVPSKSRGKSSTAAVEGGGEAEDP